VIKMSWEKVLKADVDELEKVAKELDKAVEMHRSQAERIRAHIKAMKSGGKNYGIREQVKRGD
tara:strand:- start:250 stop:438 length:189 start_codon:yes stop_codon:yes gene_type:complete